MIIEHEGDKTQFHLPYDQDRGSGQKLFLLQEFGELLCVLAATYNHLRSGV